ncbi:hypothetical protein H5410_050619 [Solanum commersonii]|uniref:Uncharacterized protein n=1 Tax=Solanum commersonii TaxID=4109 RepID=A0A9J5WYF8_SOLCO|nr:hypothetical protein H5410_050619 [Solanum commersonii]
MFFEPFLMIKLSLLSARMDPPWIHTKGRGRGRSAPGRSSQGLSYRSSSNSPIIQMGRRTLINKKISSQEESSSSSKQSVNLEDIPKDSPLYGLMQAYSAAQSKRNFLFLSPKRILMISNPTKNYRKKK